MMAKSEWEPEESFYDDSSNNGKIQTKSVKHLSTVDILPGTEFAKGNPVLHSKTFQPTNELLQNQDYARKRDLIQHVVKSMVSRVQHHLDGSRISNVLTDMTAHLRVALLLLVLLFCTDESKLQHIGDNIHRTLVLMRLQLALSNVIGSVQEKPNMPSEDASGKEISVGSFGSNSHLQHLGALKETFSTLCMYFRDTFDYRKFHTMEEIFAEKLAASKHFIWIHRLEDRTDDTQHGIADKKAQAELEWTQRRFQEQMTKYQEIHGQLQAQVQTNQNIIYRNLMEVKSLRHHFKQNADARQEDETKRHLAKMAKFTRIRGDTAAKMAKFTRIRGDTDGKTADFEKVVAHFYSNDKSVICGISARICGGG
ncbi:hypothetical protein RvY_00087 [Ramazzottius varieornatus]|uniref:Uncharacterized protein n=1 Tax=Ramazzottius varieornatus TaxID=947166 RepID=A0A1D1UBH9_RAMVA|nr:hypothetical protein RvY_00087 [Ramazzottius varieornatus]